MGIIEITVMILAVSLVTFTIVHNLQKKKRSVSACSGCSCSAGCNMVSKAGSCSS